MSKYYEHIKTLINGMISSSFMKISDQKLDFNLFIEYLEKKYSISESNFEYKLTYNDTTSKKEYNHFLTLDNSIYVEIQTFSESDLEKGIDYIEDSKIRFILAYSSQSNNNKLIKFMSVINTFIIKNKKDKTNV